MFPVFCRESQRTDIFFGGRGAGFDGSRKSLKIHFKGRYFPSDLISANAYLVVEYDLHLTVLGMFEIHFNWDSFCRSGI